MFKSKSSLWLTICGALTLGAEIEIDVNAAAAPHESGGFTTRLYNDSPHKLHVYWDDNKDGVSMGPISASGTMNVNTFTGHKFFMTKTGIV